MAFWLLTTSPKVGSVSVRSFGLRKMTRLNRLKYDMRNSALTCSPMLKCLLMEMFSFKFHGARKPPRTRGAVPSVHRPGLVKAAALTPGSPLYTLLYENSCCTPATTSTRLQGAQLFPSGSPGAATLPPVPVKNGSPVEYVRIGLICQPPSRLLATPLLFRKALPLPIGSS